MLQIYSKNNCPACINTKTLLKKYNIEYEEIKIDEVPEAKAFVLAEGHRQIPQIYNKGELFVKGGWLGLMEMEETEIKALLYGKEKLNMS